MNSYHCIKKVSLLFFSLLTLVFYQHSFANDSLKKLDVFLFANSVECNFPYKIVKDLNGKTVLNHIDKNTPINIYVGALTSERFTVYVNPNSVGDRKEVNRPKVLAEIVGREAGDEYKEVIQTKLKSMGLENIKFIDSSIHWRCDVMNGYHITAVLRLDLDLPIGDEIKAGFKSGQITLLGEIPATEIIVPIYDKIKNEFVDVNRTIDLLQKNPESIGAIVKYKQGQNYMKLKSTGPCIIKPKDGTERASKLGFRVSNAVKKRFNYNNEQNAALVVDTVDALWQNIQAGKCDVSFTTGEEFGFLRKALENSKDDQFRVELGQDQAETLLSFVQSNGYKDMDAYRFAINFTPNLTPNQISSLARYDVVSSDNVKTVLSRMRATKYEKDDGNPSVDMILQFLSDEENGKQSGMSATAYRTKRVKEEEARIQQEKIRFAKLQEQRAKKSYSLGVVCMGTDLASTLMQNIVSMYDRNTNVMAISNYVTSVPGCLFPRQSASFQGSTLVEVFRSGRFVGVRTKQQTNGQYVFGMVTSSDWDMTGGR
jgi:hypothetical protein